MGGGGGPNQLRTLPVGAVYDCPNQVRTRTFIIPTLSENSPPNCRGGRDRAVVDGTYRGIGMGGGGGPNQLRTLPVGAVYDCPNQVRTRTFIIPTLSENSPPNCRGGRDRAVVDGTYRGNRNRRGSTNQLRTLHVGAVYDCPNQVRTRTLIIPTLSENSPPNCRGGRDRAVVDGTYRGNRNRRGSTNQLRTLHVGAVYDCPNQVRNPHLYHSDNL